MLDLAGSDGGTPAGHLSAASGMARVGQRLFVVADDELSLGVFDLAADGPGRMVRLFEGELSVDHRERKAEKPDLEALTVLPASPGYPFGALLGVGSARSRTGSALHFCASTKTAPWTAAAVTST